MKIAQEFTVERPVGVVWSFFQDIPAVAECLPGAKLTADKGGGIYAGTVSVRLGPISTLFEGEATVTTDPAAHSGHVDGKGVDRRNASRSRMTLDYRLMEAPEGTRVTVDADVVLSGTLAQFGRTGIVTEIANILVRDFVTRLEGRLAPPSAPSPAAPPQAGPIVAPSAPAAAVPPVAPPPAPASTPSAAATEVKALSLLLRALLAWLKSLVSGHRPG